MEVLWFILALLWVVMLPVCGAICYRKGLNAKKIVIESLSFQQALKWLLTKEKYRHQADIHKINKDLSLLKNVVVPDPDPNLWVDLK